MRPQTPHRSPRQAFGGNDNNQLLKLHHNGKNNLARNPLDKIPIAAAVSPPPRSATMRTPSRQTVNLAERSTQAPLQQIGPFGLQDFEKALAP